jgi:hypothetical protein
VPQGGGQIDQSVVLKVPVVFNAVPMATDLLVKPFIGLLPLGEQVLMAWAAVRMGRFGDGTFMGWHPPRFGRHKCNTNVRLPSKAPTTSVISHIGTYLPKLMTCTTIDPASSDFMMDGHIIV